MALETATGDLTVVLKAIKDVLKAAGRPAGTDQISFLGSDRDMSVCSSYRLGNLAVDAGRRSDTGYRSILHRKVESSSCANPCLNL